MAFWTYILRCADGQYYTGHTEDLERRIGEHQTGAIKGFTSSKLPVILVWSEYFQTRLEAIEAELRIKKWSKAKKEALAQGDWKAVSYFAKPPKERLSKPHGVSTSLDTNGERGGDSNGERGGDSNGEGKGDSDEEAKGDTNGFENSASPKPFVSSEVETPISPTAKNTELSNPFVSSEVETPIGQNHPVDAKSTKCR